MLFQFVAFVISSDCDLLYTNDGCATCVSHYGDRQCGWCASSQKCISVNDIVTFLYREVLYICPDPEYISVARKNATLMHITLWNQNALSTYYLFRCTLSILPLCIFSSLLYILVRRMILLLIYLMNIYPIIIWCIIFLFIIQ